MQALAIEAVKSLIAWFVWPALLHSLWIGLLAASVVALVLQALRTPFTPRSICDPARRARRDDSGTCRSHLYSACDH